MNDLTADMALCKNVVQKALRKSGAAAVDDLYQEAAVAIMRARATFDAARSVPWEAYVRVVVKRHLIDYCVREGKHGGRGINPINLTLEFPDGDVAEGEIPRWQTMPDGSAALEEVVAEVVDAERAIDTARRLPEPYGLVCSLMLEGASDRCIAEALDVADTTASLLRKRVGALVRRELNLPDPTPRKRGCGTRTTYQRGCRCDDCRAANHHYIRNRRLRGLVG